MSTTIGKSKINNKEATIRGLLAVGFSETYRSNKYRTFHREGGRVTWMVGKSGALRLTQGPLSNSITYTDKVQHRAFRYIGRLHEVVKNGIDTERYQDIWKAIVVGDIPVTKDGYHAEA